MLRPLCGGATLRAPCLIDLQQLGRAQGARCRPLTSLNREPLGPLGVEPRPEPTASNSSRRAGEDTPSLRLVCARALRRRLDKAEQCSDWDRRPLREAQAAYAALDAAVLLRLWDARPAP